MSVPGRLGHSSARCLVTWSGGRLGGRDGQQSAQVFFLGAEPACRPSMVPPARTTSSCSRMPSAPVMITRM